MLDASRYCTALRHLKEAIGWSKHRTFISSPLKSKGFCWEKCLSRFGDYVDKHTVLLDINIKSVLVYRILGCYLLNATRRLGVFKNRILRKIFIPEGEITGSWRAFHSEELNKLYPSPRIMKIVKSRAMKWTRYVVRMGRMKNACKNLARKTDGKRSFRRHWNR
jgi:hypothetical protein